MSLKKYQKIIIKIGSSLLTKEDHINESWLKNIAADIANIKKKYQNKIIIVSSGSVALGINHLNKTHKKNQISYKQASSAIGQTYLMQNYQNIFEKENLQTAQILLTGKEANDRESYLNATKTVNLLLENDVIPIINENDTIAIDEIKIGDNDRLAARVAQMIDADLLILLSDVDGLYDSNPYKNHNAKLIEFIEEINQSIENYAQDSNSDYGTGGMKTKIQATKIAFNTGCDVIISNGKIKNPISKIFINKIKYSFFKAKNENLNARKQWILDSFNISRGVTIDNNAQEAIINGSSLLPVGIKEVFGKFNEDEVIIIKNQQEEHIASGISLYSSNDLLKVIGKKTSEIEQILPDKIKSEVINRSNLVIK